MKIQLIQSTILVKCKQSNTDRSQKIHAKLKHNVETAVQVQVEDYGGS